MSSPSTLLDHPTRLALAVAAGAVALAVAGGALLAYGGPLAAAAAVVAAGGAIWALRSLRTTFVGLLAVLTLIPFATLPFKIVLIPTFVDIALGGVLALWALDAYRSTTRGERVAWPLPAGWPLAMFLVLCVLSFVAGLAHASLTPNVLRHFVELLLSVAFFFAVGWYASERERLYALAAALMLLGALAATVGVALWLLPDETANRVLSALDVVGYPGGSVIRYIEDNPDLPERAIGTSVDPNVFGGLLTLTTTLVLPQVFTRRPLLPRPLAWAAAGVGGLALLLTFSRSAFVGLGVAAMFLGFGRYRRLVVAMVVAVALMLLLPQTQFYVTRFAAGLANEDLATQMRFGEYKDALILIQRFPFFGVGFAGAPDIDIYLGVSSMYLLMAEQMGLVGLGTFLVVMVVLFARAWQARRQVAADEQLAAVWLGLHAALLAALVNGVLDHYFFNFDFHHAVTLFWIVAGLAAAATVVGQRE